MSPRTQLSTTLKLLVLACLALPVCAQTTGAPPTPFKQCPAIGSSPSCGILIVINASGTVNVYADTNVPAYDLKVGGDDTLIGVQNNSGHTITSIPLNGGQIPIFEFEGDGICDPSIGANPAGCPFGGIYGYEGPGVTFTGINGQFDSTGYYCDYTDVWACATGSGGTYTSGTVNFTPGIPTGGSAYFALEEALTAAQITIPLSTTCPTPTATVNTQYSSQLLGTGGNGVYRWSLASGSLGNLALNTSGLISGLPNTAGTLSFNLQIADSISDPPTTQACSIKVSAAPLSLNCNAPQGALTAGSQFSATCTAAGGTPTYAFTYASVPTWITATNTATTTTLSGTVPNPPPATFSPVVTVTDSTSPTKQTQSQTINIAIAAPALIISCPTSTSGTAGVSLSVTCTAAGGTAPYAWTYSNLPSWLSGGTSGASITISGTPPAAGSVGFTVTVTDSTSPTKQFQSQPVSIVIGAPTLVINCPATSSATAGTKFTATCTATGGTPGYNWTYSSLPSWLTGGASGASVTITGTPPAPPPASYTFTVTLTDSAVPGTTVQIKTQTMTVNVAVQPVQSVTISQNTGTSTAAQAALSVQFGAAATATYTGTLTLTFKPSASVTNVPANYVDPAAGFPISGNTTGLSTTFTVATGQTGANAQFALGTVAGTWTATVTSLTGGVPTPAPTFSVNVAPQMVITPASVAIVNKSATGFTVQLTGFSTIREVQSGTFTFSPASGTQLSGNTSITVPFNNLDQSQWFTTANGLSAGGTFSLSLPFAYSGDPTAIGSVSVTLTNSASQTSTAVSGN